MIMNTTQVKCPTSFFNTGVNHYEALVYGDTDKFFRSRINDNPSLYHGGHITKSRVLK
jgi:hypothetical protein